MILATVSASQAKLDLHSLAQEVSPGQAHHLLQLHPLLLDTSMSLTGTQLALLPLALGQRLLVFASVLPKEVSLKLLPWP